MRSAAVLSALLFSSVAAAQTSFPMVTHANPVAVQRGRTSDVTVACNAASSLIGSFKVLIEGTGVTAEVAPENGAKPAVQEKVPTPPAGSKSKVVVSGPKVRLWVSVASNAPLGVREFRVATAHGLSSLGQLLIVDDPVVPEAAGNNVPAKALAVPVPSVVCGRIKAVENVDYFKIKGRAGKVYTLEVLCARIQDKIHDLQKHADPYVAVLDAEGHEIAAADDNYFADPMLSFTAPRDGDYLVLVRDAKFEGDTRWAYALSITDRPYVNQFFPMGVNPVREATVEPFGSASRLQRSWTFTPPSHPGLHAVSLTYPGGETNQAPLVVTLLPLVVEQEPNDAPEQANRITVPCGINGRIGAKRDLDHFIFKGTKGKAVRLEVFARRFGTVLRSQLDSMLEVMTPAGKVLMANDDAAGKDSALTFIPPADGDYVIRLRDLNSKGGEGFIYYLEADWARPDFTMKCEQSKASIGPGARACWYAVVTRLNGFDGPVKVEVQGLPPRVTVNPLTIPAHMTTGALVLSAEPEAKLDAAAVKIVGTAEAKDEAGKPVALTHTAEAIEEIYMPGGGKGRFDATMQAVAVTEPVDILNVKAGPTRIELKPGQEAKIEVKVERSPSYDKPISLDIPVRHLSTVYANPLPAGVAVVESKSKTQLGKGSVGHIVIKAAANAPDSTDVPICVQAYVSVNFVVKTGYASELILVSVKK